MGNVPSRRADERSDLLVPSERWSVRTDYDVIISKRSHSSSRVLLNTFPSSTSLLDISVETAAPRALVMQEPALVRYSNVHMAVYDLCVLHLDGRNAFQRSQLTAEERFWDDARGFVGQVQAHVKEFAEAVLEQPAVATFGSPPTGFASLSQIAATVTPLTAALAYTGAEGGGTFSFLATYAGATVVMRFLDPTMAAFGESVESRIRRRLGLPEQGATALPHANEPKSIGRATQPASPGIEDSTATSDD